MKTNKLVFLGLILSGLILSSCGKVSPSSDVNSNTIPPSEESSDIVPSSEETSSSEDISSVSSEASSSSEEQVTYMTVSEAVALANQVGQDGTAQRQYVMGTVKNITNSTYGEMYITDGANDLYIYGVYSSDGKLRYSEMDNKPYSGDEVYLYGIVKTYNGSPEMGASWLQKFVSHQGEIDLSEYTSMNIDAARNEAKGSKVIVTGVVAKITYANGRVPNGIYLVDDTSSIYVYSNEIAGRVSVGDEVKLAGTRDDYILESEVALSEKWGYKGSVQIADAIFVESIKQNQNPLKDWIEQSTVKDLLETPFTPNITTKIYKVNAIVNKVPGSGFVNYYINDLDNKTGSYVYTLCNGSDFSYLDAVDGKICTVYFALHNAKATASGAYYRLMPIDVKENTSFSMNDHGVLLFALNYYVFPQFKKEYNADPELELMTSVNNEYIPFENVHIGYSSDSELVSFSLLSGIGKLIMHLADGTGEAKVNIHASYKEVSVDTVVSFQVINVDLPETMAISDAMVEDDDQIVTVRGIVMSSLINQTGFYLNDGTGVIAIRTDSTTIKNINMGNEVVMQGKKTHFKSTATNLGQNCIDEATLVANLMGTHEYSKDPFVTNKTFEEIFEYKNTVGTDDYTCTVFVAQCYLRKNAGGYSTNYYLSNADHTKEFYLYAGSGSQYAAYDAFSDGNTLLTVEFALCNWNTKSEYRACIISASDGTTTILNNYNFK